MKIPVTFAKYIGKNFLLNVGMVFAVLVGLILMFDSIEMVRRAHSKDVPMSIIIEMVLLKAPTLLQQVLPFAVLLGGILTFSKLTRTSELVAARSAGLSVWQFLLPAFIASFAIGIFVMCVFNPLSASMLSRFEKIEAKYFRGSTSMLSVSASGLWLRQQNDEGGKTIIHALRVSNENTQLFDVTFFMFGEDNRFIQRVDAKTARLKDGFWYINDAILTIPGLQTAKKTNYKFETNLSIHQIQDSFAPPETLSFWQLPGFIKDLKEAGFSALRHLLYWHSMLVMPFLFCAMVFFAAAFSLRLPRQGKTGALMAGGILAGFMIKFISDIVAAIGLSGSIPVMFAAWVPVGISIMLGAVLMLHLEDG